MRSCCSSSTTQICTTLRQSPERSISALVLVCPVGFPSSLRTSSCSSALIRPLLLLVFGQFGKAVGLSGVVGYPGVVIRQVKAFNENSVLESPGFGPQFKLKFTEICEATAKLITGSFNNL